MKIHNINPIIIVKLNILFKLSLTTWVSIIILDLFIENPSRDNVKISLDVKSHQVSVCYIQFSAIYRIDNTVK
jgi:hypothetical protein